MLILSSTSDLIRVVTGASASVTCSVACVDNTSGVISVPDTPPIAAITSATTTTIVAAPGSGVQRYNGTYAADLMGVTLLPSENLMMDETGCWRHHDAQGGEYTHTVPARGCLGATGVFAETIPRELCPEVNSTIGASGTLFLQAIYLNAGQLVSNISISSATTAVATGTNGFFALYDASRNLLAQSANYTSEAWAANTIKTKAMTTPYRVPTSGLYYIGLLQVATTIATIKGGTARTGGQLGGLAPSLHGNSSTGLTTTLPNPAAAITAGTASMYAAVS